jgi:hypothetical protein
MTVNPSTLFDSTDGVKSWRSRLGVQHLRDQWRDHSDKPEHFGLAFDGANPPKRRKVPGVPEWTRKAHCTACEAKAVLSASWDEPTLCRVTFQGSCIHKHGITINQRVTGTARAQLRESAMKPMQLRGTELTALSTEARQAGNLYGVPSKAAAKKISSERNHRFRLHKVPWTSLNLQQDASRAAHVNRHQLAGLPPPKVLGSIHNLGRFPPSLTLTSEAKILLADGLLPQFPVQIDWSMNHMRDCDEDWSVDGRDNKPLSNLAMVIQHPSSARPLRYLTLVAKDTTGDATVSALYANPVLQRKVLGRLLNIRYIMMDMGKNCSRTAAMYLLGLNFPKYLAAEWLRLNARKARTPTDKILEWCLRHVLHGPQVHIMSKKKIPDCEPQHQRSQLLALTLAILRFVHPAPDIDSLNGRITGCQEFLTCAELPLPNHDQVHGQSTVQFGNGTPEVFCTLLWAHTADTLVTWTVTLNFLDLPWVLTHPPLTSAASVLVSLPNCVVMPAPPTVPSEPFLVTCSQSHYCLPRVSYFNPGRL